MLPFTVEPGLALLGFAAICLALLAFLMYLWLAGGRKGHRRRRTLRDLKKRR